MIISKTPLRIPIGGGGTDLPSFYSLFGNYFISAAIDKYIYIIVQERKYYDKFLIKYSRTETVKKIGSIKNELVREALKLLKIARPIEIVSIADVSSQTGLGSSSAFTVGLLNALHAFKKEFISPAQLAEEACHIAIDILGLPSGKQDEYITSFGGLTSFKINHQGRVTTFKDRFHPNFVSELEHYLYMFYTGKTRYSKEVLEEQKLQTLNNNQQVIKNLKEIQKLGYEIDKALKNEDAHCFGKLLHEHWLIKKQRSKTTNSKIDQWYEIARKNGALGGKIMGAGGGGFFLFYCEKEAPQMIRNLEKTGLKHIPFNFDYNGTKVIADF